jgi:hypothetical protein
MKSIVLVIVILVVSSSCFAGVLEEADKLSSENKSIQAQLDDLLHRGFFGYSNNEDVAKELTLRYKYNRERYEELRKTKEGSSLYPMPIVQAAFGDDDMPRTKLEIAKIKKDEEKVAKEFDRIAWDVMVVICAIVIFTLFFMGCRYLIIAACDSVANAAAKEKKPNKFDY